MMRQIFRRFFAPLLVAVLFAGTALAQQRGANPAGEETGRNPPALQYAVASFSTMLVLVILCMPSRKQHTA